MYRLDKTAFRAGKAEEADNWRAYWREKSPRERLRAASYLIASAFGFSIDQPPALDRTAFKMRRRMRNEFFGQDFMEFIQALNQAEVEYLLVGGYAVILHGHNRTTGDMDIWVNPTTDNYAKLSKAFSIFRMPVFDMTEANFLDTEAFDIFTFGASPIAIDIMTMVKGLDFQNCYKRKLSIKLDKGLHVNLLALSDLLKAKKASGRNKDIDDIRHLS